MTWISQEEMEQRIRWLRQHEGYDGATLGTPVLAAFVLPPRELSTDTCQVCGRWLTRAQQSDAQPTCSRVCGYVWRGDRRRSA